MDIIIYYNILYSCIRICRDIEVRWRSVWMFSRMVECNLMFLLPLRELGSNTLSWNQFLWVIVGLSGDVVCPKTASLTGEMMMNQWTSKIPSVIFAKLVGWRSITMKSRVFLPISIMLTQTRSTDTGVINKSAGSFPNRAGRYTLLFDCPLLVFRFRMAWNSEHQVRARKPWGSSDFVISFG